MLRQGLYSLSGTVVLHFSGLKDHYSFFRAPINPNWNLHANLSHATVLPFPKNFFFLSFFFFFLFLFLWGGGGGALVDHLHSPGNYNSTSYFPLKTMTFKTPLPSELFPPANDLPSTGGGGGGKVGESMDIF